VLLAAAVKVVEEPLHIGLLDTESVTVGVSTLVTFIEMLLELAVVEVRQLPPVMVITQVTAFALANVFVV
jgi:hypothetical protein